MAGPESESVNYLSLKVIAPRAPRNLVARSNLRGEHAPWRHHQVVAVEAPAGFGKTSLLGLWRRDLLADGSAVAWITCDIHDRPSQFVQALVYAVRSAVAMPSFG